MKFKLAILILVLGVLPFGLFAQQSKLAQQYYASGEYEKAAQLYQQLYEKGTNVDYYFNRYIECLIALEDYDRCEATIKQQLARYPDDIQLYVTYGNLYERQYRDEEAKAMYQKAIEGLPEDRFTITRLANAFTNLTKYELAISAYERGAKLLKDDTVFSYNLGDLYRRKGDAAPMIENYLLSLTVNPGRVNQLKSIFQRYLSKDDFDELQVQLYDRIQDEPDIPLYPELLAWVFIQRKDYRNALRQSRALDRQLDENGGRVMRIAEIAANDGEFDVAIEAYNYVINEKGTTSTFYVEAKRASLNCQRQKITQGFDYAETDLRALEADYDTFLNEFGRNQMTAPIIAELAELEAFYLNDLEKAIALLDDMIKYPGINEFVLARGKLSLADFYLMKGEIWEATLLYSQVDKAHKDDLLGHEARYRNAKLSYFAGDFQWAQTQFDILKASTSKLISNDALDLSIFIMDHLGLDTTEAALKFYSEADLLVFQNRFDDAFLKLDSLAKQFPEHALEDDILYTKSKIYQKTRQYDQAAAMLQSIIDDHSDGIRADNALYELAQLYENQLNDTEQAKALYEKIFIDYSGSTFAVDARKRFRILRGDNLQ